MCTKTTQTRLFCFPQKSSVAFLPAKRLFARSQRGKKDAFARQFVRRHKSQSSLVVSSARASKPAPAAAPSRALAGPFMKSPASPSPRRARGVAFSFSCLRSSRSRTRAAHPRVAERSSPLSRRQSPKENTGGCFFPVWPPPPSPGRPRAAQATSVEAVAESYFQLGASFLASL